MATSLFRSIASSFSKQRVPNGPYKAALERCNVVAFEEYENAARLLEDAEMLLRTLQGRLARIAASASRGTVSTKLAAEELDGFSRTLAQAIEENSRNVRDSLDAKYRRLADFSITLFGRTMAGKSTIREAITGGDGRTIGKGSQRTTRDIRVYEWESLRIVDTPGIAAYLGEQDRDVALSVVAESDVILFIASSDSIQEEEIEGLACLRAQNKPIIFVLNVKEDLTKPVFFKRFVSNPDRLFAEEKIGGYVHRLDRIVREKLAMQSHTIVPIHAQAAFLSNRPDFASSGEALRHGSRLEDLLDVLKREVVTTGPIRRVQCISDNMALHLVDLEATLAEQAKRAGDTARLLASKVELLQDWENRSTEAWDQAVTSRLAEQLQPLRNSISAFVDENIERSDFGVRWNGLVEAQHLNDWAKAIQQQIIEECEVRLQEFARQLRADAEFLSFDVDAEPASFGASDVKRTLKWVSVGGSVLAGIAGVASMIAASNIWNPIGWAAAAVGIGAWLLSFLFDDRETKLQSHKRKTADELRAFVDKLESQITSELLKWFREKVAQKEIRRVVSDTDALRGGMAQMASQLSEGTARLRAMIDSLNIRVYARTSAHLGRSVQDSDVISVARDPGVQGLAVVSPALARNGFAADVGRALNERVWAVEDSSPEIIIEAAFRGFGIGIEHIRVDGTRAVVRLAPRHEGPGFDRLHVALTARVLGMTIDVEQNR